MSAAQDFIATVHVIATSDHTETTLNQGINQIFARYVDAASKFLSKQQDGSARIRALIGELDGELEREISRSHVGRLGALIDHAHELTSRWLAGA